MVRAAGARDRGPMPETPDSPGPPTEPASPRRLLRSRRDRVLSGVCAGIARYFDIDPLIVRIAAVALAFVGGAGLIAYVAAYFLVPADDGSGAAERDAPSRLATIAGAVAVVLAGVALLHANFGFGLAWTLAPFGFVVLVLAIAGQRLLRRRGVDDPPLARVVKAGLLIAVLLLGCALLSAGSAWATAAGGGTAVAIGVVVLGVAMVALSFRSGDARWLALPALALAIPAGIVSAAGITLDGGVGQRTYTPATIADLKPGGYRLGAGELDVDLRRMAWPQGSQVALKVDNSTGHALILVPADVCVQATTKAGLGYVNVLGQDYGGADLDDENGTVARFAGRKLIISGKVGIGALEIRHHGDGHWRSDRSGDRVPDTISPALARAGCAGEPE